MKVYLVQCKRGVSFQPLVDTDYLSHNLSQRACNLL